MHCAPLYNNISHTHLPLLTTIQSTNNPAYQNDTEIIALRPMHLSHISLLFCLGPVPSQLTKLTSSGAFGGIGGKSTTRQVTPESSDSGIRLPWWSVNSSSPTVVSGKPLVLPIIVKPGSMGGGAEPSAASGFAGLRVLSEMKIALPLLSWPRTRESIEGSCLSSWGAP